MATKNKFEQSSLSEITELTWRYMRDQLTAKEFLDAVMDWIRRFEDARMIARSIFG